MRRVRGNDGSRFGRNWSHCGRVDGRWNSMLTLGPPEAHNIPCQGQDGS